MIGPFQENSIVVGDCLDVMAKMPDGCCDLIFADPPYNMGKADWDKGHDWHGWVAEAVRVLKFNGAMWVIHRDARELAKISEYIEVQGGPPLVNWITWDLYNGAEENRGYLDGFTLPDALRSFQQMAEYLIYHTMTATDANQYSVDGKFIFEPLRAYLAGEWERAGLTAEDARLAVGCAAGSGLPSHWFSRSQWMLPTEEKYHQLQAYANHRGSRNLVRKYSDLHEEYEYLRREYEYLRREYEDLRPTFNNPGRVSSVWQGPPAAKNGHETPKPEWLLERIISTTSNEGDLIFDPFMGSGTTAVAADRLGRRWFGCDTNPAYVKMALERIEADRQQRAQLEMAL